MKVPYNISAGITYGPQGYSAPPLQTANKFLEFVLHKDHSGPAAPSKPHLKSYTQEEVSNKLQGGPWVVTKEFMWELGYRTTHSNRGTPSPKKPPRQQHNPKNTTSHREDYSREQYPGEVPHWTILPHQVFRHFLHREKATMAQRPTEDRSPPRYGKQRIPPSQRPIEQVR